jgi:hypothetical protein
LRRLHESKRPRKSLKEGKRRGWTISGDLERNRRQWKISRRGLIFKSDIVTIRPVAWAETGNDAPLNAFERPWKGLKERILWIWRYVSGQ